MSRSICMACLAAGCLATGCSESAERDGNSNSVESPGFAARDEVNARAGSSDILPKQNTETDSDSRPGPVNDYPPIEHYLKRGAKPLQPRIMQLPDIKRLVYQVSPVGARRMTDYNRFTVNSGDWLGLDYDGSTVWIYTLYEVGASSYLFDTSPNRSGNRLLPGQSINRGGVIGIWKLTPASGKADFQILPLTPSQVPHRQQHPMTQLVVLPPYQFLIFEDRLIRRAMQGGEMKSVPIAGSGLHLKKMATGELFAISSDAILRIDPEALDWKVLASTRRNPPAHDLDKAGPYDSGSVWSGQAGIFRVAVKREHSMVVYELARDGSHAKEILEMERIPFGPQSTSGHAFFPTGSTGFSSTGALLVLPHDSNSARIGMVHGLEAHINLSHLIDDHGRIISQWFAPPGFHASESQVLELSSGFLLKGYFMPYQQPHGIPSNTFFSDSTETVLAYFDFDAAGAAMFSLRLNRPPNSQPGTGFKKEKVFKLNDGVVFLRSGRKFYHYLPDATYQEEALQLARQTPAFSRPQPVSERTQKWLDHRAWRKSLQNSPDSQPDQDERYEIMSSASSIQQNIARIDRNRNLVIDGNESEFIDLNRDGKIDVQESRNLAVVYRIFAQSIVDKADHNRDHSLSQSEIQQSVKQWEALPMAEKMQFPRLDRLQSADVNGDGILTVEEIGTDLADAYVASRSPAASRPPLRHQIPERFRHLDLNGDGFIEPHEYKARQDELRQSQ